MRSPISPLSRVRRFYLLVHAAITTGRAPPIAPPRTHEVSIGKDQNDRPRITTTIPKTAPPITINTNLSMTESYRVIQCSIANLRGLG